MVNGTARRLDPNAPAAGGPQPPQPPPHATGELEPWIVVVVPAYKHPQHLKDAVISAARQTMRDRLKVVIVNDGCPLPSTDWMARHLRDAFPGTVYYLTQANAGPSAARNHAVRFALAAWPSVGAVFPLDSDNRLSPGTLETLWDTLAAAPGDVGWVYQDLILFGTEDVHAHVGVPFSAYRLAHENFCDAGSLIHRRVFERGILFDETMRVGYEDWEFFIHAAFAGFRGAHAPDSGFLYRKHGHSRNEEGRREHDALLDYIRHKHAPRFGYNEMTRLEHGQMPRFALVEPDRSRARYVTNPSDPSARRLPLSRFVADASEWASQPAPKTTYIPPVAVFAGGLFTDFLSELRLLPGLLLCVQKLLPRVDYVCMTLGRAESPYTMEVDLREGPAAGDARLLAILPRKWVELKGIPYFGDRLGGLIATGKELNTRTLHLKVGGAYFEGRLARFRPLLGRPLPGRRGARRGRDAAGLAASATRILDGIPVRPESLARDGRRAGQESFLLSNTNFAAWQHVERDVTTLPYWPRPAAARSGAGQGPDQPPARPLDIWFVAPWIRMGGVDRCVLHLARELRDLSPDYRVHLLLTADPNVFEAHPQWLRAFETITLLPAGVSASERRQELLDVLGHADVVVNAHSRPAYELLGRIKGRARSGGVGVKYLSYLHVTDVEKDGRPCGYPLLASREYENLIDHFVVISQRLRRQCANLGVPEEKILVMPNAATVSPPTLDAALALADRKGRRRFSKARPIRVLFSGRFDPQKGYDRLPAIATRLAAAGVPFELEVVGKSVMGGGGPRDPRQRIPRARFRPATADARVLKGYYAAADIFLMPSRWEGVPLAALEAMSFGCVVVATDVGAVGEAVAGGTTGFLLDSEQPEEGIAAAAAEAIAGVAADPGAYAGMRAGAVRASMSASWARSAAALAKLVDPHFAARAAAAAAPVNVSEAQGLQEGNVR